MLPARMASFGAVLAAMAVLLSAVNVQGQQLAVDMTASFPGAVDRISVLTCAYSASDQDNFTLSYISPNGSVGVTTFTDLDSSMGNRNFTVTVMIGTYYCVLNDTEDTQYNASVTLNAPSVSIAPSPSITVTAGQSRTLQCTSTGAFASLAWTLNNGAPLPGNAMQTSMSSVTSQPVSVNLSLSHLNESVSFRCTATGGLGTSSANTSVIVIGPPTVASFPNSDFNESQTIELPCGVLSDPVADVTFTLNTVNGSDSQELSNDSSRVSIMPLGTGNGLRLVITNATVKDTGNYTCTAVNQAGTGALTASVNVFTLPRVSLQPPDVEHRINASSEFAVTCRAVGFREPTISWQDDAEYSLHTLSSIPVDAFQVEARSKLNTTDFMGSRKNYSVTCVGSNAAGSQMASTTIIVQGVPEMVNLSVAKDMASQGLRFSWVPGSNGNIPSSSSITYVLTASFNNASRMQTEELHRGSNSLSVLVPFTTLVPNTDYQFFVVAMNFIGRSSQSNIVRNRTPEAVPSAPVNLRLVPINPRSIKVTWDKPREANGVITNYTVEFSGTTQEHRSYCAPMGGMFVNVTSTELRNATLTGLCPFTRYDVFVGAINGAGRGQRVNNSVMTPATNASPPRNLTATVSRDTSGPHWDATLSWSRPEFQNGMFSQYLIEYTLMGACNLASTDGTSQLASTNTTSTTTMTTTIMLSFLHANSNYSFVVRQSNGESLPGEKAVFSTCTGFSAPASGGIAQPAMASNTGMPEQTSTTLLFSLVQPSQQNGPISFCQVLALETDGSSDSTQNPDDIYSNAVTDVTEYDRTRSEPPSSTPWVAAEFELKFFRNLFTLGNPNMYNSNASMRYNGPLKPSTAYRIALRCFIAPNTVRLESRYTQRNQMFS
ncbi:netrin receptor unc-40-like [Sycon ciliatum]|uniref:netrin receptor unc-40-like n=1 Tax=Sycon ciliatum TaxID=27933 RepID=UPI0031F6B820